jgi:hypothetical protein
VASRASDKRTRIFLFIEDEEYPEKPSSQRSEFANGHGSDEGASTKTTERAEKLSPFEIAD